MSPSFPAAKRTFSQQKEISRLRLAKLALRSLCSGCVTGSSGCEADAAAAQGEVAVEKLVQWLMKEM